MATIKLKIYVAELTNVMSLYDAIEVQRTATAPPAETPVDLTENTAQPAKLTGTIEGPYLLNGTSMTFKVNGTETAVTFISPNPVAILDVVDEVNSSLIAHGVDASSSEVGGKLEIATDGSGTQFTLEMISGTALSILGFTAGDKDNGEAQHIPLVVGTTLYEFDDGSGLSSYYYRTRFINTLNGTYSAWSDWIQGQTGAIIDSANLIVGKVKLAGIDGVALSGRKIIIANVFQPNKVDGYGVFGDYVELETNGVGYAETTLIRGAKVDVIFSGTSIIRRILVPSIGTEFDLLDDSLVVQDEFSIHVPDIPYGVRRS